MLTIIGVTMNSNQLFEGIEHIAETPGKKDKERLVATLLEDSLGFLVLTYAYDPFKTYGIAKVPESDHNDGGFFDARTFTLLEELARRNLTGNAAREAVKAEFERLSPEGEELLARVIKKDLRAGFTDGTINRVRPGTVAEFPYMRCVLPKKAKLDKWPWAKGIVSQVKADGMFANVNVYSDGSVSIHSRQGTPFPAYHPDLELLTADLAKLDRERQYHGELLVRNAAGIVPRQIGNGMINSVVQGGSLEAGYAIQFSVWDTIPLEAAKPKAEHKEPYTARLMTLLNMLKGQDPGAYVSLIETRMVRSMAEAYAHSTDCLARGLEGTIIKNPGGFWRDTSSGNPDVVKIKLEVTVELKVVGVTKGTGKRADTFGALTCRTSDDLLEVNVGSGITDASLAALMAMHGAGTLVGSIVSVTFNDLLAPSASNPLHSLFLPRYVEIRTDKTEADSLDKVRDQYEAAKQGPNVLKEAA